MGYETTLLIGKKYNHGYRSNDNAKFFQVFATLDLSKCGYESEVSNLKSHKDKDSEPEVYFYYDTDGNHELTEDRYGDKPIPLPIDVVLQAIKKDAEKDDYRRFQWAISLLESMKDDEENLSVLLYGH